MTIALVFITDGRREYAEQAIRSAAKHLPEFDHALAVDDSADDAYGGWLKVAFGGTVIHHDTRQGLSGALQTAWAALPFDVDWVFHLEDDFVFPGPVPVDDMVDLAETRDFAQMCLVRQPCNPTEARAGGLLWGYPADLHLEHGCVWQTHLFSLNPCVYPRWVTQIGWPTTGGDREYTDPLLEVRPDARFGYYGAADDPPRCLHIGMERTQTWKL